jgi:HK97 family phage major capsid protein
MYPTYRNRDFNILHVIQTMIDPSAERKVDVGYEREVSAELARKMGRNATGVYIPTRALIPSDFQSRGLTVGTATAGGHTVATNLLASSFIDLLRNYSWVVEAGAVELSGLNGNVAIPRQNGTAQSYWVAENEAVTASQPSFDQVTMSPKTIGAYTDLSRRLILQSSLEIQDLIKRDLVASIGLEIDRAAINGSGSSNEPLGLLNHAGITTLETGNAALTWTDIVALETKVSEANANFGAMAFAMTPEIRAQLMQVPLFPDVPSDAVWDMDSKSLHGMKAFVSNQLPKNGGSGSGNTIICGNWNDLIIGQWGVLDLQVDPYSLSGTGGVRLVAMADVDIAVRHPESFACFRDVAV